MLSRRTARVRTVEDCPERGLQRVQTDFGPAIAFPELTGPVCADDLVLVNRTAVDLALGTGGADFVIARLSPQDPDTPAARREDGHLMTLRYTPLQHTVRHVEDLPEFAAAEEGDLDGMPVVAAQLHSQVAPVAAASALAANPCGYVMSDSAALPLGLSDLCHALHTSGLILQSIAVGQAFASGGCGLNAVTTHNALLYLRSCSGLRLAVVAPGPGNTGTNTRYGFSGIEQASMLDIIAALGGAPIACVRMSSADPRERHRGISHHTRTVLSLVRSRVTVALPEGVEAPAEWRDRHDVRFASRERTSAALEELAERRIDVRTMGRTIAQDELFFHAAAAAGVVASEIAVRGSPNVKTSG